MQMPSINNCDVDKCSYNHGKTCHALAVTIGQSVSPMCDTYWDKGSKGGDPQQKGRVGACRMSDCKFNDSLECQADKGISVGLKDREPDCLTFNAQ